MPPVSPSPAPLAGPVFVRLLARLAEPGAGAGAGPPLAATLAQWIDWPRAVTLAGALDDRLAVPTQGAALDEAEQAACQRVRAQLRAGIVDEPLLAVPGLPPPDGSTPDFAPFRMRYLGHQRAALVATGRLRGRLREMLAASPRLARLAEVDAAMEQVLAPREHALLAGVPDLLGRHFDRLRQKASPAATAAAWLDRFRLDMRELLLAELDLRFSPVEALLAALRTPEPTP